MELSNEEQIAALKLENEDLKDRVTRLEGCVYGLQAVVEILRREKAQPWIQPFPWTLPNIPYIGTPQAPYTIWSQTSG